jgi:capsular exopolysaccharide synthesis family protein
LKLASGGKVVHIARESKPVELITFRDSRSVLAEAFRDLRTSVLLSSSAERAPKSLLVTSSHKGEGKTTTAINLAITLAQAGEKVLLFDCDMRNPSIARALGLDNSVGISTVLSGTAVDSSPLIQYTMVPNLFLCAAGQIPPNPAELIGSVRLRHCLKAFSNTYDHVIIDSPPLLSVTDARILATMVDGVILVIRGGDTTKEAVERSRRLLVDVRARIMGTMLNNVDLHSAYPYYSRYHYDRYGYGYGYGQK